jgi:pimeloyl-ACP methyl ester carboxylesterase
VWLPLIHRVARARRAVALDLPGHGRSAGRTAGVDDWVAAIGAAAGALCLGPSVLVGHSLGGLAALAAALAYPDKVAGLILVTTAARLAVSPRLLDRIAGDWTHFPEAMREMAYAPETPAEVRERSFGLAFSADQAQTLADFRAADAFDARARLGEIGCPTLVIAGSHDRMVPPSAAAELAAGIAGARLETLGAGHLPMHEQPDGFAAAVIDHLARLGA